MASKAEKEKIHIEMEETLEPFECFNEDFGGHISF
jgi:hypothetical protein